MCVNVLLPRYKFQYKTAMEENIYENHNDNSAHLDEDDRSSVNTDIPSDPWFDEQDVYTNITAQKSIQTTESNDDSIIYSIGLDETNLKEQADELYSDLVTIERTEKELEIQGYTELENLKREVEKLRKADSVNSAEIAALKKENTNLKKSFCSFFMTVSSEIQHKDQQLAEANRKIDRLLFEKNTQNFRTNRTAKNQSANNDIDTSYKNSHKRKKVAEYPRSSRNEKGSMSTVSKSKNSNLASDRNAKHVSERNCHKSKEVDNQAFQKNSNQAAILETPEIIKFSENSRASTEANNLFFNLMSESVNKAFYEFEQNQIISLNRLKQSFIKDYFNTNTSIPCSNVEFKTSTPKRSKSQGFFYKHHQQHQDPESVNTTQLLTSHSDRNDRTVINNSDLVERPSKITKSMQQDLVSLFKYKKEKIPFLDKRKFGLLKDGKDLIPENLL